MQNQINKTKFLTYIVLLCFGFTSIISTPSITMPEFQANLADLMIRDDFKNPTLHEKKESLKLFVQHLSNSSHYLPLRSFLENQEKIVKKQAKKYRRSRFFISKLIRGYTSQSNLMPSQAINQLDVYIMMNLISCIILLKKGISAFKTDLPLLILGPSLLAFEVLINKIDNVIEKKNQPILQTFSDKHNYLHDLHIKLFHSQAAKNSSLRLEIPLIG